MDIYRCFYCICMCAVYCKYDKFNTTTLFQLFMLTSVHHNNNSKIFLFHNIHNIMNYTNPQMWELQLYYCLVIWH